MNKLIIINKIDELLDSKSISDIINLETDNIYNKSASSRIIRNYIARELRYDTKTLTKYGLKLKFIGVDRNYNCFEAMSFPNNSLYDICFQKWDLGDVFLSASLLKELQASFLFIPIIKQKANGSYNSYREWEIGDLSYWSPSEEELNNIGEEWKTAQSIINRGVSLREVKFGKGYRTENNLINQSQSKFIHLRPHAKNKEDYDEPYYMHKGIKITKQSFWLNKRYVNSILKNNKWKAN